MKGRSVTDGEGTVKGEKCAENEALATRPPPKCRYRPEFHFGRLKTPKYSFPDQQIPKHVLKLLKIQPNYNYTRLIPKLLWGPRGQAAGTAYLGKPETWM